MLQRRMIRGLARYGETSMKALMAFSFIVASLMLSAALSACSDEVGGNYYENEIHSGYPGPGTRSPGRDS